MKRTTYLLGLLMLAVSCDKGGDTPAPQPDPKLRIDDLSLLEGNTANGSFNVTVKLDKPAAKKVTLTYSTVEGTAKAGEDFTAVTAGTASLEPGEKEKTIAIPIVGDEFKEGEDEFTVRIESATGAVLQRQTATVQIRNDDTKVGFTDEGFEAPASYPGYTLAWQEEFSGTAINENVWSFETGNGCPNNCGFGNNELQTYTRDNAYLQDGKLIIEAKREGTGYTSTRMISRDKKTFKFGRIDIRARLPKGKGIWPALWMMPQASKFGTWPASGEIDIMELVGHEPSKVHGTVHYGPAWPNNLNKGGSFSLPAGTFSDAFHVFSIEWQADVIRWYVDNQLFFTLNKADLGNHNYPFNEDFFFIINLAVGGNWPGSPDAQTYFPQFLIVDYLRVYQ